MGLRKKRHALAPLQPDIAVLQEVSELDVSQDEQHYWIGNNRHKGLGVIGFNGLLVSVHPDYDPRIEFVVPIQVTGPTEFLLFAVWVMYDRALNRIHERPNRWQMLQALEAYEPLLVSRRSIVAGDFNNAVQWDRPRRASNHSVAASKLSDLGLVSVYETSFAADQDQEPYPTLFWRRRQHATYQIDYIWFPRPWLPALRAVQIGDYATWVQSGLSDHVPLTVELDNAIIGRL